MREREKIMLVGVGELGGIILEYMCRIPGVGEIVTADYRRRLKTETVVEAV